MTYKIYPEQDVEAIAEAIRNKNGLSNKYKIGEMAEAINNLGIYSLSGEDNAPYLYRKTPLTSDAELDKIVGGSVVLNQLVTNGNCADGTNNWSVAGGTTAIIDGEYEITLTIGTCQFYQNIVQKVEGHKVLCSFDAHATNTMEMGVVWGYTLKSHISVNTSKAHIDFIGNVGTGNNNLNFISTGTAGDKIYLSNIQLIDLTQMFGTTIADYVYQLEQSTAGAGVSYLKSLGFFTDDYYPYNSGEIKSVSGLSSHDMVGKNLLNWTITNQYFDSAYNGFGQEKWQDRIEMPSAWYGKTLTYSAYIVAGSSAGNQCVRVWFYKDGTYVPVYQSGNPIVANQSGTSAITITVPNDGTVNQIGLGVSANDATFSNPQIEIGTTATAYEPYIKHSYPLDNTLTLRGIPKLSDGKIYYDGDTYNSDGSVVRKYGVVDLGSLNWTKDQNRENVFYVAIPTKSSNSPVVCGKYPCNNVYIDVSIDKYISGKSSYNTGVFVRDTAYTTAADFKAAMQGVYLIYELAEPTTETAEPYSTIQICDGAGTEEYVTTGIPVGHETKYLESVEF